MTCLALWGWAWHALHHDMPCTMTCLTPWHWSWHALHLDLAPWGWAWHALHHDVEHDMPYTWHALHCRRCCLAIWKHCGHSTGPSSVLTTHCWLDCYNPNQEISNPRCVPSCPYGTCWSTYSTIWQIAAYIERTVLFYQSFEHMTYEVLRIVLTSNSDVCLTSSIASTFSFKAPPSPVYSNQ